jgi:hypothetical protein
VVKCGRLPGRGIVTLDAGMRELIRDVTGAGGIIEVGLVAGITIC